MRVSNEFLVLGNSKDQFNVILNIHSLPDPQLKRPMQKRHIEYDEAHQNTVNCTEAYSQCSNSVWSSWFMMESMADLYKHMH